MSSSMKHQRLFRGCPKISECMQLRNQLITVFHHYWWYGVQRTTPQTRDLLLHLAQIHVILFYFLVIHSFRAPQLQSRTFSSFLLSWLRHHHHTSHSIHMPPPLRTQCDQYCPQLSDESYRPYRSYPSKITNSLIRPAAPSRFATLLSHLLSYFCWRLAAFPFQLSIKPSSHPFVSSSASFTFLLIIQPILPVIVFNIPQLSKQSPLACLLN